MRWIINNTIFIANYFCSIWCTWWKKKKRWGWNASTKSQQATKSIFRHNERKQSPTERAATCTAQRWLLCFLPSNKISQQQFFPLTTSMIAIDTYSRYLLPSHWHHVPTMRFIVGSYEQPQSSNLSRLISTCNNQTEQPYHPSFSKQQHSLRQLRILHVLN